MLYVTLLSIANSNICSRVVQQSESSDDDDTDSESDDESVVKLNKLEFKLVHNDWWWAST